MPFIGPLPRSLQVRPFLESGRIAEVVDPALHGFFELHEMHQLAAVAWHALRDRPEDRPTMGQVREAEGKGQGREADAG